jgi:hypothetical protein
MDFAVERADMIMQLRQEIKDERVIRAIAKIPRESFVPVENQHLAYTDGPLPIGFGQTISQPYIVAVMTEALGLNGEEKVLELGTGSGDPTPLDDTRYNIGKRGSEWLKKDINPKRSSTSYAKPKFCSARVTLLGSPVRSWESPIRPIIAGVKATVV